MTIEADLRAAATRADADSRLLHEIVHGDAATTVDTEGGPVKSVAKAIGDVETRCRRRGRGRARRRGNRSRP